MPADRTQKRRPRGTLSVKEEMRMLTQQIAIRANQLNGGQRPTRRLPCPTNEHSTTWGGHGHSPIASVWTKNDGHLGMFYSLVSVTRPLCFGEALIHHAVVRRWRWRQGVPFPLLPTQYHRI